MIIRTNWGQLQVVVVKEVLPTIILHYYYYYYSESITKNVCPFPESDPNQAITHINEFSESWVCWKKEK